MFKKLFIARQAKVFDLKPKRSYRHKYRKDKQ